MKKLTAILSVLLALLLCMSASAEAPATGYFLGGRIGDFTVTAYDGETVTLSELLEEKEMVLLHFWATWCGPCGREFPYLEEAYQQYQDQIEVVALSCEPSDTPEVLAEYAESMGLTFEIAQDAPGLIDKFGLYTIPASVVIDRYGVVCYIGGPMRDADSFLRLFDAFTGDDYEQSLLLTDVPPKKPDVAAAPEAELAAALEASAAINPTGAYTWPMLVTEKDGRSAVVSTNVGCDSTASAVTVPVTAAAGDAIAVTFRTSTETAADMFHIAVNGETVKLFSGERDWTTYAIPVDAAGEYLVTCSYTKDISIYSGEDRVWIDSVAVLSGDAAAEAIAANPFYPTADSISIMPADNTPKEIVITDPYGILEANFGPAHYYIVGSDTVTVNAGLTADVDPEGAFFHHYGVNQLYPLTGCMTETGYTMTTAMDSLETTGLPFTLITLYLNPEMDDFRTIFFFADEANASVFAEGMGFEGWSYTEEETPAELPAALTEAAYTLRCVDQNGAPVEGVMLQICDATTCQVVQTDAEGVYTFTSAPYAWEIHVLMAPAGYTAGDEAVFTLPEGGETVFTLTKADS